MNATSPVLKINVSDVGNQTQFSWQTQESMFILGKNHPLFEVFPVELTQYLIEQELIIFYNTSAWNLSLLNEERLVTFDKRPLPHKEPTQINHQSTLEIDGLVLSFETETSTPINTEPPQNREQAQRSLKKLRDGFNDAHFFEQIGSHSAQSNLRRAEEFENLDLLDQLALEGEMAVYNPSLLKELRQKIEQRHKKSPLAPSLPELNYLLGITRHKERTAIETFDNTNEIKNMIAFGDEEDTILDNLKPIVDYDIFRMNLQPDPLLLLYSDAQKKAASFDFLPEITEREHHSATVDSFLGEERKMLRQGENITVSTVDITPQILNLDEQEDIPIATSDDILEMFSSPLGKKK